MWSFWEYFVSVDWERYAALSARVSMASCFVLSLMTFLFGFPLWSGIYTTLLGFFLLLLETQLIEGVGVCFRMKEFCLEKLLLKHPAVKGLLYYCLAVPCFIESSPVVLSGVLINFTCLFELFAQCNRYAGSNYVFTTLLL